MAEIKIPLPTHNQMEEVLKKQWFKEKHTQKVL